MTGASAVDVAVTPIDAVAAYSGEVRSAIKALKYDGEVDRAATLAALLVAHLDAHDDPASVDLILPNPTHPGRPVRHTELVLGAARDIAGGRWPFSDPAAPVIEKRYETARSFGEGRDKRAAAAAELREALGVVLAEHIRGRRIVVYDDVVTTGAQLLAVAAFLRMNGAISVRCVASAVATRGRPLPDADSMLHRNRPVQLPLIPNQIGRSISTRRSGLVR